MTKTRALAGEFEACIEGVARGRAVTVWKDKRGSREVDPPPPPPPDAFAGLFYAKFEALKRGVYYP
jgi:hypothetical protein